MKPLQSPTLGNIGPIPCPLGVTREDRKGLRGIGRDHRPPGLDEGMSCFAEAKQLDLFFSAPRQERCQSREDPCDGLLAYDHALRRSEKRAAVVLDRMQDQVPSEGARARMPPEGISNSQRLFQPWIQVVEIDHLETEAPRLGGDEGLDIGPCRMTAAVTSRAISIWRADKRGAVWAVAA